MSKATAKVIPFPGDHIIRAIGDDRDPAAALMRALTKLLAGADVVVCTDALMRMLAAICSVNSINDTDAIELAQLLGADLVELVKAMRAPEEPEGEGAAR